MIPLLETLLEFTNAGTVQNRDSAGESNWKSYWSREVTVGGKQIVKVEGGCSTPMPSVHTAIIRVTVEPLNFRGEDAATETIIVFSEGFTDEKRAEERLMSLKP
jgi:hypothetical protein